MPQCDIYTNLLKISCLSQQLWEEVTAFFVVDLVRSTLRKIRLDVGWTEKPELGQFDFLQGNIIKGVKIDQMVCDIGYKRFSIMTNYILNFIIRSELRSQHSSVLLPHIFSNTKTVFLKWWFSH